MGSGFRNDGEQLSLILVAHGDRGADKSNRWLLDHRDALRARNMFASVEAGVLNGDPAFETALSAGVDAIPDRVFIYPLCMSDGYFVRKILRERLTAANCPIRATILPPLGLHPELPDLLLEQALAATDTGEHGSGPTRLLLVGHGSKYGPASARATEQMAAALRTAACFATVDTAFLEERPFLEDALACMAQPTIVSGFFSGAGMHAAADVPNAIAKAGTPATYAGSIGLHKGIPDLILSATAQAAER